MIECYIACLLRFPPIANYPLHHDSGQGRSANIRRFVEFRVLWHVERPPGHSKAGNEQHSDLSRHGRACRVPARRTRSTSVAGICGVRSGLKAPGDLSPSLWTKHSGLFDRCDDPSALGDFVHLQFKALYRLGVKSRVLNAPLPSRDRQGVGSKV